MSRPRATLGHLVDDLGSTLLDVVAGRIEPDAEVGSIVIHDPAEDQPTAEGALVLGVGVRRAADVVCLLRRLGAGGAVALVVRLPVEGGEEAGEAIRAAAAEAGVVLLGLKPGASWGQVAALARSLLAGDGGQGVETLGGPATGGLFALADAIAALLDAPITIEDRNSRVLAYSKRQDRADRPRIETILGRQMPQRYTRRLERRGVFERLYRSDRPVYLDGHGSYLSRAAIRVSAGDEILGTIWATVDQPLTPERERTFIDASKIVSMHLLRERAADAGRRLRSTLLSAVLEGGPGAGTAAARLGITAGPACVLALTHRTHRYGGDAAQLEAERQRVSAAFVTHLAATHPHGVAADIGAVTYAVLPVPDAREGADHRGVHVASEFLDRLRRPEIVIGVGRVVPTHAELLRSRADADVVLRVLRSYRVKRRVAKLADVHVDALLLQLADLVAAAEQGPTGPVARLMAYDAEHGTDLVATLRAWLDAFGDVNAAAAARHVHPNTVRYRLRRLARIGGLDLSDPEDRFAAMLLLRLFDRSAGEVTDPAVAS